MVEAPKSPEIGERKPKTFNEKLRRLWNTSSLCVGLDMDWSQIPGEFKRLGREEGTFQYSVVQVESTSDLVCAYKPNIAFFEDDPAGERALERVVGYIHDKSPYIPVIGDVKRGDIGNTNTGYIRAAFDRYNFDAVTVNPRFGQEALQPFLDRKNKGIIPVVRTSNPGSDEFQNWPVSIEAVAENREDFLEIYNAVGSLHMPEWLAELWRISRKWNANDNCAVVIGATHADELTMARKIAPDITILLPGVGAQQADVQKTVANGMSRDGKGMIINASRSINFAKRRDEETVGEASRREALKLRDEINYYRENPEGLTEIQKAAADALLEIGAIKFGGYKIKMHTRRPDAPLSPIYIDLRILRSAPKDVVLKVCAVYQELLNDLKFDVYADIPTAITPIVAILSHISNVPMVTPRPDSKTYGSGARIDGIYKEGDTAILIDDLITDGGSKTKPANKLRSQGINVSDVVTLIDREQGGRETLEENDLSLHAAFTISNLLRYYLRTEQIEENVYRECMDYFAKFN